MLNDDDDDDDDDITISVGTQKLAQDNERPEDVDGFSRLSCRRAGVSLPTHLLAALSVSLVSCTRESEEEEEEDGERKNTLR